ncbi:MAG TPA: AI-2E family transporter [Mycobacteriales bacterium]|nr:AI-2E family transporter [Mycobacteriales bacterium]
MDPDEEARALAELVTESAETQTFSRDEMVRRAAAGASSERPFGLPGRPLSRRSPFVIGLTGALGVAVAVLIAEAVLKAWHVIILIVIAMFVAIGLDPVVAWLTQRGWRRSLAVTVVIVGALAVLAGFIASAVPALTTEYHHLSTQVPHLLHRLQQRHDAIGRAARNVHLSSSTVTKVVSFQGVVSAGRTVLSAVVATLTVVVLTIYLLANLPAIKATAYRLVPRHRRARVGLLTDEILRLVGGYLLGNLFTSAVAGVAMMVFLLAIGVPDAVFLGLLVALFDLIPMIGAPVAGVIVALVALSESLPKAIAVVVFTITFRLLEDYLLSPKVMRRTVEVAPTVTVIAVLIGGTLLGIVGALIAVPVAAALDLIRREVVQPQLDAT